MAAFDVEVDICALKQQRAQSRVRDIVAKRTEYQRACSNPRPRSSAPADRVKPHRLARTVASSHVAKGLMQGKADRPSIITMERSTSAQAQKKPSVAAMVSCGADLFAEEARSPLNEYSDAGVAAFLGNNFGKSAVRVSGLAPSASDVAHTATCRLAFDEQKVQEQVKDQAVRPDEREDQAIEHRDEEGGAMDMFDGGLDICSLKMRRAESRKRHIAAKRVDYQRARTIPRAHSSDPADRVKPHRIARTAARSFVAKGFVESKSDMPSLTSMGKLTAAHARKKPSVASLVQCGFAPCPEKLILPSEESHDCDTTASEGEGVHDVLPASRPEVVSDSDSGVESKLTVDKSCTQELVTPQDGEQEREEDSGLHQEEEGEGEVSAKKSSTDDESPSRREQVLRTLVDQLRAQSDDERRRALEANAQKQVLEQQLQAVAGTASKASKTQEKKVALQLEKRQAAEMRKRRHQEQQLRQLKERADTELQAAERMREEAEAEAIAAKARHLAEAEVVAQCEAEAFALVEAERVRGQTEELVQQRMAELAQTQAALKAGAAAEAAEIAARAASDTLSVQALAEQMRAQTEAEVRSMKVRAEVESRVIKAKAQMEARDMKVAMEAERRTQLEAQAREQAQAEAQAQAELATRETAAREAQRHAEVEAQREAAAALKRARELEQQRSRQFRKQQEQERKRAQTKERELEAARAKAKEESEALRAQALAEANAMKAKAEAEARAIRARAEEANAKAEAKVTDELEPLQSSQSQAVARTEQPPQQEQQLEPTRSEAAKVEREFVGRILDFELQEADGVDEETHEDAARSTEPMPEEGGWEVLPTADSRPSSASSKAWWNIFF